MRRSLAIAPALGPLLLPSTASLAALTAATRRGASRMALCSAVKAASESKLQLQLQPQSEFGFWQCRSMRGCALAIRRHSHSLSRNISAPSAPSAPSAHHDTSFPDPHSAATHHSFSALHVPYHRLHPTLVSTSTNTFTKSSLAFKELWPDLSDADIAAIMAKMETVEFDAGESIAEEGTDGTPLSHFFIILEGSATVFKSDSVDESTNLVKLITLRPGDVFGESQLFNNEAPGASLVAAEPQTRVARLSVSAFREILHSNESVNGALLRSLSTELGKFRTSLGRALRIRHEHVDVTMCVFDSKPHEASSFEAAVDKFRQTHSINIKYLPVKLCAETVSLAAGSQVVCIFVNDSANADILTRLASLGVKCIALRCAGFNNVDLKAARALGMEVVRVPAYSPYAVAEHAVTLIMALNRKIVHAHSRVKQGNFSLSNLVGFDMYGKTVGVIGTGKIGVCFIKIMIGFGCNVLCYDVYRNPEVVALPNTRYVDNIDELYQKSRVISIHCPLLPTTKYMINAESIAKMQRDVMIINTSRGPLINTKDLIKGLKSGQIGSAGLDVYEEESAYFFEDMSDKVMTDDVLARLMTFNNVIVTSHQAFLTEEALRAIAETTMFNVGEFLENKTGSALSNNVVA